MKMKLVRAIAILSTVAGFFLPLPARADKTLLNVSYDPTR